ncbi:helix-turn-helix transcriptional regulator [Caulobacter sp. FWC2]|uniref:helix-turn-helix domain-containing protein n=1 Tax=Caulobacter sp. FWC2 TaxID=69664 RepID=UPI0021014CBD|nr:helix-turn-helix transcriptional regulator [Caulobacter sp. FWC2]
MPSIVLVKRASEELRRQGQLLSQILKHIRELRHMSARQVADAMGLPLRTYYNFESGTGALDIARLWRFADATGSDPVSILESLMHGSIDHALRCIDNQAASIQRASFQKFEDKVGDRMTNIAPQFFIEAFKRSFDSLESHMDKTDQGAERWLAENLPKIGPSDK